MKRLLYILIAAAMGLLCAIPAFSAEEQTGPEKSVYIDDSGDDSKDGKTAENAVQTFQRAQELLGDTGGAILIRDVYTYQSVFPYYMPYREGAFYTIRGSKEDGSSVFVHARKNICLSNPVTFDRLTYRITASTWSSLIARFNRLEITNTVRTVPYNEVEERNNYLFVYGGDYGAGGKDGQNSEVILNGGTYGYVVAGCQKAEMRGNASLTVGGNARIINRVYLGGDGVQTDVYGDIHLLVSGGTVEDSIYAGGSGGADESFISGNVFIKVTGGSFKSIICHGTSGGQLLGQISIDCSEYEPSAADGWKDSKIVDLPADGKLLLWGEQAPADTTERETDPADTDQPKPPVQTTAPAASDTTVSTNHTSDSAGTAPADKAGSGCQSALSAGALTVILGACLGAGVLTGRKRFRK